MGGTDTLSKKNLRGRDLADYAALVALAIVGTAAMAWAIAVFPTFSSEIAIANVARAVAAGEVFKPRVLASLDSKMGNDSGSGLRSSVLGKAAIIRIRQAEDAIRSGDLARIDRSLEAAAKIIETSLSNAPNDSFLWLARFWVRNLTEGMRTEHLRDLKMSYEIGRYEGWVSLRRNYLALSYYSVLPSELAELTATEFVSLVRWGFAEQAAAIAAGPGRQRRNILFPKLKDLKVDERRRFAQAMYRRELDDVQVPGFAPLTPHIPIPVLPPGF